MKAFINQFKRFLPITFSLLVVGLISYSCDEEQKPLAEITVLKDDGVPLGDARVIISCTEPGCIVADTQFTNFNGISLHEFELPAVLKVTAFKVSTTTIDTGFPPQTVVIGEDSLCGEEFITVKEDELARKIVIVQPTNGDPCGS